MSRMRIPLRIPVSRRRRFGALVPLHVALLAMNLAARHGNVAQTIWSVPGLVLLNFTSVDIQA